MIENNDKIFRLIIKCLKNGSKPDLHSFTIKTEKGIAFVDCRCGEVFIEIHSCDGKQQFCGTAVAATNRLINFGADFESVEI